MRAGRDGVGGGEINEWEGTLNGRRRGSRGISQRAGRVLRIRGREINGLVSIPPATVGGASYVSRASCALERRVPACEPEIRDFRPNCAACLIGTIFSHTPFHSAIVSWPSTPHNRDDPSYNICLNDDSLLAHAHISLYGETSGRHVYNERCPPISRAFDKILSNPRVKPPTVRSQRTNSNARRRYFPRVRYYMRSSCSGGSRQTCFVRRVPKTNEPLYS